jgi:hypothetical protein
METGWSLIGIDVVIAAVMVAFAAVTGWRPARRASAADRALAEIWSGRRRIRRPATHTHQRRPQRLYSRAGNYSRASNAR